MDLPVADLCTSALERRFWSKVEESEGGCWLWTGYRRPDGYGHIAVDGRKVLVHRLAHELLVGPAPPTLDHTCHNEDDSCKGGRECTHRLCVNPAHLRAATTQANLLAGRTLAASNREKSECPAGHPLAGVNLYVSPRGHRSCRECKRRQCRESYHRRKAARST